MKVRLSEFTYKRLVEGLGEELKFYSIDEHGFYQVELPPRVVREARKFGGEIDTALNEWINFEQRRDPRWKRPQ